MEYKTLPSHVLKLAVEVEEEGVAFYRLLAKRTADETIKNTLMFFAGQEIAHRATFLKMAEELGAKETELSLSVDIMELIRISVDKLKSSVFALNSTGAETIDLKKGLDIAIHTEAQSVKIYSQMEKSFPPLFNAVLSRIVDEEITHLNMLLEAKERLNL
jgi:rubrerythrin